MDTYTLYSTIYYDRLCRQYRYILCIREYPPFNSDIKPWVRKIQREVLSPFETFSKERRTYTNICLYGLWCKERNTFFSLEELNEIIGLFRSFGYVINTNLSNVFSRTSWLFNPDSFIAVVKKIDI